MRWPDAGDGQWAGGRAAEHARGAAGLLTAEGRALVDRLTPYDPGTALGALAAARRDPTWADRPDVVAAAATQARLRTRAAARFPGPPRWWTPDGVEQATRPEVAARHAARYVAAGVTHVADLGCGAGSDALAFAGAGLRVTAHDLDPDALWALAATAADRGLAITVTQADVRDGRAPWNQPPGGSGPRSSGGPDACFVDPARRRSGTRMRAPETWSPPWSWVCALAGRVAATGASIAPGVDHAALPREAQVEWVSVAGDLVEAGAWWGPLRDGPARRVATVLRDGMAAVLDDTGGVPEPEVGPVGPWLIEPDPAVLRAGLVSLLAARVGGRLLDPRIAYVAADREPEPSGLGRRFAVLDEAPFARKPLRAWLRARGFGDVVVKKRGINVVPEELRAALRLSGVGPTATLVLTRTGAGPLALLVEPR